MTVGILGIGEVGKAIQMLANKHFKVLTKDIDHNRLKRKRIDILHICIPYTDDFADTVLETLTEANIRHVIINSTVKPGTTRSIYRTWAHQHNGNSIKIAHTPIMGIHPDLADYQQVFKKAVGAIDEESFTRTRDHWLKLGAPEVIQFESPESTELAKLLSTTYYGWSILFNKLVKQLTEDADLDFDQVYTQFNRIYNHGYAQTRPEVTRPVLKHMPGPIGGHCVIPNIEILNQMYESNAFEWMLQLNKQFAREEASDMLESLTVDKLAQADQAV